MWSQIIQCQCKSVFLWCHRWEGAAAMLARCHYVSGLEAAATPRILLYWVKMASKASSLCIMAPKTIGCNRHHTTLNSSCFTLVTIATLKPTHTRCFHYRQSIVACLLPSGWMALLWRCPSQILAALTKLCTAWDRKEKKNSNPHKLYWHDSASHRRVSSSSRTNFDLWPPTSQHSSPLSPSGHYWQIWRGSFKPVLWGHHTHDLWPLSTKDLITWSPDDLKTTWPPPVAAPISLGVVVWENKNKSGWTWIIFYLLDFFDIDQFDDFVPLGRARPGAGALEAQITENKEETRFTHRC